MPRDSRQSGQNPRMAPKLYADTTVRRTRQIVSDVWFVIWTVLWIWLATRLYDLIIPLGTPGVKLQEAGDSLSSNMVSAGEFVDRIPLVGDGIRVPFDKMSEAGTSLAEAGATQNEVVTSLALYLSVLVAFLAISLLLLIWLPFRIRFVRRATAAQKFLATTDDLDLFALRALARQPLTALVEIDPDPASAWRAGDAGVIRALATLELRDEGLRVPGLTEA